MPNSSITLQSIVDDAASLGDVSPALATGGWSDGPALSIANDAMQAMVNGGPAAQPFNWKWNRINVKPFPTISYQQDYFVPGLINLGWLENAWASNINQTSIPKQKEQLEVKKDLEVTYDQTGYPGKICWEPNDTLQTGKWGMFPLGPQAGIPTSGGGFGLQFGQTFGGGQGSTIGYAGLNPGGLQNPGPFVIYTNPINTLQNPTNATTCITDLNGNLWVLTTFGTCGATEPTWPTSITYPTLQNPTATATTVADGTCVWTAINPKGQGFRLNPIPPQTGIVWLIQPVGQMRAPRFSSLTQTLEPIPDDYATHFKQGFFAECYRRNPDPKVRAKYPMERNLWLEALDKSVRQGDREMDDVGFYPGVSIMDGGGWGGNPIRPDYPFNGR